MKPNYLIVGSGLSALVFGALMANSGKTVQILEAHEHPGGFGHTFTMAKKYTFNAQFHYVWDCGEGQTVNRVLNKLGLDQEVTFERYDPDGFDHMRMPGYALDIPSEPEELMQRLSALFPAHGDRIRQFLNDVEKTSAGLKRLAPPVKPIELLKHTGEVFSTVQYLNSTLQDVFDKFQLPQAAQTLLALQWPDFLLPPNQLSFYAWVALFKGYQAGAFYPTQHFEHVINSLVKVIESHGGQVLLNHEVTNFRVIDKTVTGVEAMDLNTHQTQEFTGDTVICNIDPKKAAKMIGESKFSKSVRQKLNYEYSASNYMVYCVVKDIDLRDYGFGKWNLFHTGDHDLIEKILERFKGKVLLDVKIANISRNPDGVKIERSHGEIQEFDKVVFATPPDQVIALLADPTDTEIKRFCAWRANYVTTTVHMDTSMYDNYDIHHPSEFDFFQTDTRWGYNSYLNQLCGISSPENYFLSFQLEGLIAKDRIIYTQEHHTPLYTTESFRYRDEIIATNGENNTYYAGAYLGDGLHEGAIASAFRVAQLIGSPRLTPFLVLTTGTQTQ